MRFRMVVVAAAALAILAGGTTVGVIGARKTATPPVARLEQRVSARLVSDTAATASGTSTEALSLQNDFATAAERALPGVVEVNVVQTDTRRQGLGSGVIVARNPETVWVLTNAHVAAEADRVQIVLADGRVFEGKLVGTDQDTDLALLSFRTRDTVPLATLGDSDSLRVGDWVMAVGNPYGFESTVTAGIVSALDRHVDKDSGIASLPAYIQTDASINSGNSGGALVNLRGEVVGISTWIASQTGESIGIGFAIPINTVRDTLNRLLRGGGVRKTA